MDGRCFCPDLRSSSSADPPLQVLVNLIRTAAEWSLVADQLTLVIRDWKSHLPFLFLLLILATRFPSAGLTAAHFRANWLPMIGARQPSELNY